MMMENLVDVGLASDRMTMDWTIAMSGSFHQMPHRRATRIFH